MSVRALVRVASVALVLSATGCEQATLELFWDIAGAAGSPSSCAAIGATETRVVLVDETGTIAHDGHVSCDRGVTTLQVASGWYAASFTAEDAEGNRVAPPAEVPAFFVGQNETVVESGTIVASSPE